MTPAFEDLPLAPEGPPGNAWGRFGDQDELGTLNLITPDTIVRAAKEIQTGVRISLDWLLSKPSHPSFGRKGFQQEIVHRSPNCINDDILTFNTQGSSQWDGFRHYAHQKSQSSDVIGLHTVVEAGGITGRGVLLDYAQWAATKKLEIQPLSSTPITVESLEAMVKDFKIEIHPGDILLIRSGFTAAYNELNEQERINLAQRPSPDFIGVEATENMLRWLWKYQFGAVAGDAPSFERAPIRGPHADPRYNLHEWVLAGWGCPIGELFDLERLSQHCKATGRYTFFLSSVPLKVPGGVASPPNAIAVF
ncbi:putative cyclase-domain-containing protein [Aspergillus novoparasiticus]|uniref:Putative cyclase-domain-containing protein n=1 Tax=Aspergillus novoparasiticus TaxID=986946 RepID=A0A5N6EVK7_9EURO|nr:putative cyclase-domain-containing protein [Aspergillus novoparasiticus]